MKNTEQNNQTKKEQIIDMMFTLPLPHIAAMAEEAGITQEDIEAYKEKRQKENEEFRKSEIGKIFFGE